MQVGKAQVAWWKTLPVFFFDKKEIKLPKAKKVIYKGKEYFARELAKMLNVSPTAIFNRIKRGVSLDDIGTVRRPVKTFLINGEVVSKSELSTKYGISKETIRRNARNGTLLSCIRRALNGNVFSGRVNSKDMVKVEESTRIEVCEIKTRDNKWINGEPEKKTATVRKSVQKRENDCFDFDPDYESIRKLADKYFLKKSAVYPAMESGRYDIKYYLVRGCKCGFIRRTEIETFLAECIDRDHIKAEEKLNKQNERKLSLEELKKLHPLVTDDRFFEESYFPHLTLPITYEPENYI